VATESNHPESINQDPKQDVKHKDIAHLHIIVWIDIIGKT
jgi:hypothetical protein